VIVPVTPAKEHAGGIVGLIQDAKGTTDKNLPTAAFIPPQFMALAAVLTSLAVILIQILLSHISMLVQLGAKVAKFLADLAGGHAVEKISEREIEARGIAAKKRERHFFGLSATEILVVEAAVVMVAVAFLLADRADLTLQTVLIYMAVGAVSVILHDFAHRYFANRYGHETDIQFWGLGTVIMFLTAWLYGNAFAQSYRNLVERDETKEEIRETGIEMVSGPVVSIVLMLVFLFMVSFGGIWAIAGGLGFTINLITAVYSLMPISTMDGSAIWKWNRTLYLVLFLPLIAFYFFTFMLV
jgi:Zn-dependent protease